MRRQMMHRAGLFAGVICAGLGMLLSPSHAQTTAAVYHGGGTQYTFDRATGYLFTPTEDISVTSLGIYDLGAPGFVDRHDVGIFQRSNLAPIVRATLGAGLSGTLVDGTRFVDVTPVTLTGGTQYYIFGNNFYVDAYAFGDGAVTYAPQVTWNGFVDGSSASIDSAPVFSGPGQPGNLGPNFRFTTAAVPEPGTLALLLTAAWPGGLLLRRKRRP